MLKDEIQRIIKDGHYPKTSREKIENLILNLYSLQTVEGDIFLVKCSVDFLAKLFLRTENEYRYFIDELERKGHIRFVVNAEPAFCFTIDGLEYAASLKENRVSNNVIEPNQKYDIGLSFAGEDRPYVEKVAASLKKMGVNVFYDEYETINLWGKDLYQHLNDVYKNKCRYCIVFISKNYEKKLWTIHELKSAQARAFTENKEYILPVRFDETELPGMNSTVAYINANKVSPEELAKLVNEKLV